MSTMASMCSMSTGHSLTQAPHVVQAHSTSGSMTFGTSAVCSPSPPMRGPAEANMLSRRFMMRSFGRQRLVGVPRRAGRLAAPAFGAGGEVEHLLPGEVPDLAHTEHGVLVDVLHVHVGGLVQAAQSAGPAGEGHVDRRHEDVEVLRVGHEDDEARDDGDVEDEEHGGQDGVRARPQGSEQLGHARGRRRRPIRRGTGRGRCSPARRGRGAG